MKQLLLFAVLLAPITDPAAQITLEQKDLVPHIGDVQEIIFETAQQSLAELGIEVDEVGGPLELDLSGDLGIADRLTMINSILSPEEAPNSEKYPEADYAIKTEDFLGAVGTLYLFVDETSTENRLLGAEGGNDDDVFTQTLTDLYQGGTPGFPDYYPLTFGKRLAPIEVPIEYQIETMQMSGSLTMEGEVDAWGTVRVPAGSFEALRLHITARGTTAVETSDGQRIEFVQEIDQFTWLAAKAGTVAMLQEVRTVPPGDTNLPPIVITQELAETKLALSIPRPHLRAKHTGPQPSPKRLLSLNRNLCYHIICIFDKATQKAELWKSSKQC